MTPSTIHFLQSTLKEVLLFIGGCFFLKLMAIVLFDSYRNYMLERSKHRMEFRKIRLEYRAVKHGYMRWLEKLRVDRRP